MFIVHVKAFFLIFLFNSIKRIYASGWFVRMENNNCTPNTNKYVEEHFKSFYSIFYPMGFFVRRVKDDPNI